MKALPRSLAGIVATALALLAGCGGSGKDPNLVYVQGRVTDAGEPLQVKGREVGIGVVRITFHPIEGSETAPNEAAAAAVDAEGNYRLHDGIPPGEYRIAIRQWDPHPQLDRLEGRFTPDRSPVVRTITQEQNLIEIDVANPETPAGP